MKDIAEPFDFPVDEYRHTRKWISSHLRTYRQKVMDKVPVEHFLEYRYNKTTNKFEPSFHSLSTDRFQTYSNM